MIMTKLERIKNLLNEVSVPDKDDAGVIDPKGVDGSVRRKAIQDCLNILERE